MSNVAVQPHMRENLQRQGCNSIERFSFGQRTPFSTQDFFIVHVVSRFQLFSVQGEGMAEAFHLAASPRHAGTETSGSSPVDIRSSSPGVVARLGPGAALNAYYIA